MMRTLCCGLLCLGLVACGRGDNPTPATTPAPLATEEISNSGVALAAAPESINALGVIRPWQTLNLSFRASAPVKTLAVQSGSPVTAGALLAELDSSELALSLQSAQAEVTIQQAQLETVQADIHSSQADRAVAEARLQQAQIALDRLQMQVSGATLTAPFAGLVSAVYLHPGEWAEAGQPVIEIIDTSTWLVETKNVSELNIGRIHLGQHVEVRVIVFPDQALRGEVMAISPVAVVQQGDTTYTLYIELEATNLPLLAGMNVEVAIVTAPPG